MIPAEAIRVETETMAVEAAKVIYRRLPYVTPGKIKVTEWLFEVPLSYEAPGETIRLWARSAEKSENPVEPPPASKEEPKRPLAFYLQGGPGGGCPPPQDAPYTRYFIDKGYNIMCLDQRGAGLSQTLTTAVLQARGGPSAQAAYLKHFRADSITKDFEAVRRAVTADYPPEKQTATILAQSFGGFVATNYLSFYPTGLKEVFMCGGLPPLVLRQPDALYKKLVERAAKRSADFYKRFPGDLAGARRIYKYLLDNKLTTPSGGRLTPARFRAAGICLGGHTGMGALHSLIVRLNHDLDLYGFLTAPSIRAFEDFDIFDFSIIYAILHEPIYCVGRGNAARWSAERALAGSPYYGKANMASDETPVCFEAEMITHSTFEDHAELQPLMDAANILAETDDWPELYDEEQLARNEVPVYAAVYYDDLYVDFEFSQETAARIQGCQVFVTNRMFHDGIRAKTTTVLDELFALRDDVIE